MKKFLLTSLCLAICLFALCGCKKQTTTNTTSAQQKGPQELKTGNLNDSKLNDKVKLSNVSFITGEGVTVFKADVTNVTATEVTISEIDIVIKDSNGKELITFKAFVNNLAANETKTIESSMDNNLTNYATYEYVVK